MTMTKFEVLYYASGAILGALFTDYGYKLGLGTIKWFISGFILTIIIATIAAYHFTRITNGKNKINPDKL